MIGTKSAIDWNGIAVVIGAVVTALVTLGNAIMNWKHARQASNDIMAQNVILGQVATGVDGMNTELTRQNTALKKVVASNEPVPEQVAGEAGNAPVGTDKGVVTVEDEARNRRVGDAE